MQLVKLENVFPYLDHILNYLPNVLLIIKLLLSDDGIEA